MNPLNSFWKKGALEMVLIQQIMEHKKVLRTSQKFLKKFYEFSLNAIS